jgi:hypothetical protein
MPSDTHPNAEEVQIELIRKMTVAERIGVMRAMTAAAIELSRRAIAEANPDLSPKEVELLWVDVHYGKELGAQYREYLRTRGE